MKIHVWGAHNRISTYAYPVIEFLQSIEQQPVHLLQILPVQLDYYPVFS